MQMSDKNKCVCQLKGAMTTPGYSGMDRDAQFTAVLQRSAPHDETTSCR